MMEKINDLLKETKTNSNHKLDAEFNNFSKKIGLSSEEVQKNIYNIEDSITELKNCKGCKGLNYCKNHIKGYVYYPIKNESNVTFNYIPCKHLKEYEINLKNKEGNTELENARMKDIDISDKNRVKLIKWLKDFYDNYDASKINKGLYLHGTFGSGKTFLLAALLNELKIKKNADYEIVYFPEMLRNLKDNFSLLDSKVKYYSTVEILLIDDIGAEKVSDWSRDEILGTILQSRMNNHMTTFFTSNLTIDELEKHLALTKDREDALKAGRVIERIKQLTEDLELLSMNRRK